uniref:Uncharacterized protein n=1 Tax=Moniliophthora roreri TaxID=221103 RepID=A0A0W0FXD8_MONRR
MEVSSTCILKLEDDPDGPKFMGVEGDNEKDANTDDK